MLHKYATLKVLGARMGAIPAVAGDSFRKSAKRWTPIYEPRPGMLYVRSRAISSRTNDNYDTFPAAEIAKAYRTFIGKPVFVNHHNADHRRARGVIIDAVLHEDLAPDGSEDTWVEVLMEVDAVNFPKLAEAILKGKIDRTSMGTSVGVSECSYCGNRATSVVEFCKHIPAMKGRRITRTDPETGRRESVLVSEICYDLTFFENSLLVEDPADPTAVAWVEANHTGMTATATKKTAARDEAWLAGFTWETLGPSGPWVEGGVRGTHPDGGWGFLTWHSDGEIRFVEVGEEYRRRGLATELFRRAKEIKPDLHHSNQLNEYSRPWAATTASVTQAAAWPEMPRTAKALPAGITLVYSDFDAALPRIRAEDPDERMVGTLSWWSSTGEVFSVQVEPDYRRQGIATAMWELAQEHEPRLHHSTDLSPEGEAWSQTVAHAGWPHTAKVHDPELVRDRSTNNPHLRGPDREDGTPTALCNKRFKVWVYGTLSHDRAGENIWSWAACPRCEKKAAARTSKVHVPNDPSRYGDTSIRYELGGHAVMDPQDLPPVLYHVTTAGSRIGSVLHADHGKGGGLGGNTGEDRSVSFTVDRKIASDIASGMAALATAARAYKDGKDLIDVLEDMAVDEGWVWDEAERMRGHSDFSGATNSWFFARQRIAGIRNPIFFGVDVDRWASIRPSDIGVVTASREDVIASGAMVTDFDLGAGYGLEEVRVWGDVRVGGFTAFASVQTQRRPAPVQTGVFYHVTSYANWRSIRANGLHANGEGLVWLFTNTDQALRYSDSWANPEREPCIVVVRTERAVPIEGGIPGAYVVRGDLTKDEVYEVIRPGDFHYYSSLSTTADYDYRGGHQPYSGGPPLHDLLQGGDAPRDLYEHPHYYVGNYGGPEHEAIRVVQQVRGRPDAMVTIYRALPPTVPQEINPGDWISLSRSYAQMHGADRGWEEWVEPKVPGVYEMGEGWVAHEGDWPVISRQVPAWQVRWDVNDLCEMGWFPNAPRTASRQTRTAVTLPYARNPVPSPRTGGFGQDIEPAGRYLVESTTPPEGWESGIATFANPLRIDFGGGYSDPDNWKRVLSERYGGRTGEALSRAVVADGYDSIITADEYGTSEIVDLRMFTTASLQSLAADLDPDLAEQVEFVVGEDRWGKVMSAWVDGKSVGYLTWVTGTFGEWTGHGEIKDIAVEYEYQHKGLGSELYRRVKAIEPNLMHSGPFSDAGLAFARAHGFTDAVFYDADGEYGGELGYPWIEQWKVDDLRAMEATGSLGYYFNEHADQRALGQDHDLTRPRTAANLQRFAQEVLDRESGFLKAKVSLIEGDWSETYPPEADGTVVINISRQPQNRTRWTVLHEVAHALGYERGLDTFDQDHGPGFRAIFYGELLPRYGVDLPHRAASLHTATTARTASGLSLEDYISVAEEAVERTHPLAGRRWTMPRKADYPRAYENDDFWAAMEPVTEFVREVLSSEGKRVHDWFRVDVDGWHVTQMGVQGATDGLNWIDLRNPATTLTILHECAHVVRGTGEGQGHDRGFVETLARLLRRYVSPIAAEQFTHLVGFHDEMKAEGSADWPSAIHLAVMDLEADLEGFISANDHGSGCDDIARAVERDFGVPQVWGYVEHRGRREPHSWNEQGGVILDAARYVFDGEGADLMVGTRAEEPVLASYDAGDTEYLKWGSLHTAAALPAGYDLVYTPPKNWNNGQVAALLDGQVVGHIQFVPAREVRGGERQPDGSIKSVLVPLPAQVVDLKVNAEHRRKGIATALWEEARRHHPDLVHDSIVLPDGEAWIKSLGSAEREIVVSAEGHLWTWRCSVCGEGPPNRGYRDKDKAREMGHTHAQWCWDLGWDDEPMIREATAGAFKSEDVHPFGALR